MAFLRSFWTEFLIIFLHTVNNCIELGLKCSLRHLMTVQLWLFLVFQLYANVTLVLVSCSLQIYYMVASIISDDNT